MRHVAGLPVVSADVGHAVDALWADVRDRSSRVHVLVNAYSSTLRRQYPEYASLLRDARVVPLADGAALTAGSRLLGQGVLRRCPGPDLLEAAAARASTDGTTFYLLGGGPGVADRLCEELSMRHPGLRVTGTETPPYGPWDEDISDVLCAGIERAGADIVWLGVSAPKQEAWSLEHLDQIGRPVVCVGAAFDFLSGLKPRAPRWMRRAGLEWLFRLATEPQRLWRRYLIGNAVFLRDLVMFGVHPASPKVGRG